MSRIYLSPPEIRASDRTAMESALDSGWIAPVGPDLDAFEAEVAQRIGRTHACAVHSGTAALHLALLSLGVQAGDAIICPSLTFAGCAFPIRYCGAEPIFIDSEWATWNMDPELLEVAILDLRAEGRLPKAVIVVHIYGQCAQMDVITAICQKYGIPLIEDAAESLGASFQGKAAGAFGDLSFLSFNGNKIITTSGGGMLLGDNQTQIDRARFLAHQAREPVVHYEHTSVGYNYRLSNLLAALGRSQLEDLDRRISIRKAHYKAYSDALSALPGFSFMPIYSEGSPNYWLTCLKIDPLQARTDRNTVLALCESKLIEVRPTWKPLHLQPVFQSARYYGGRVAEDLFDQGLCLPSGSNLSESQRDRVIELLLEANQST